MFSKGQVVKFKTYKWVKCSEVKVVGEMANDKQVDRSGSVCEREYTSNVLLVTPVVSTIVPIL